MNNFWRAAERRWNSRYIVKFGSELGAMAFFHQTAALAASAHLGISKNVERDGVTSRTIVPFFPKNLQPTIHTVEYTSDEGNTQKALQEVGIMTLLEKNQESFVSDAEISSVMQSDPDSECCKRAAFEIAARKGYFIGTQLTGDLV